MMTFIPVQPALEAIGETVVHTEGEIHTQEEVDVGGEIRSFENDAAVAGDSSPSPLISLATTNYPETVSDSAANLSTPRKISTPARGFPEQELDASAIQPNNNSQAAQVVKPNPYVVVDDSVSKTANLAEIPPVPVESQPGSPLPQPEAIVRRASHDPLGVGLPDGKSDIPKADSVMRDGVLVDRSTPAQMNSYAQSLRDTQDSGARTQWGFQQGQHSNSDGAEGSSGFWDGQQSPQHDQAETKLPQVAVVDRQVSSGQPAESIMADAQGRAGSGPPSPPPNASFVSQAQPAMPAHDPAEQSGRVMARSVVFDLAQPDLGHVNVRVAMMNDVVNTHLSADRPEVGQFLINGQDRLQAAFQANGLDMGQFRVDIDRQGAGRSFQHGPFQEQGQTWNQGSQGMKWGQSQDSQDEPRTSLHGLLNVVA